MQEPEQQNRNQNRQNRQIVCLIAMFIMFTFMTNNNSENQNQGTTSANKIIQLINDKDSKEIDHSIPLNYLENRQVYQGHWKSLNATMNSVITKPQGKYRMIMIRNGLIQSYSYRIAMNINNGQYIDDGNIVIGTQLPHQQWETVKRENSLVVKQKQTKNETQTEQNTDQSKQKQINVDKKTEQTNNKQQIQVNPSQQTVKAQTTSEQNNTRTIAYQYNHLLQEVQAKMIQLEDYEIIFTHIKQTNSIAVSFKIDTELFSIQLQNRGLESKAFQTIIYSLVLFVISFAQISGIMRIYRGIFQGGESVTNFSWLTILILTLWDAVMCMVTFFEAFAEDNLVLFILQGFIFCFLFLNLELRLILMIFQANSNGNTHQIICKFNCLSYGSLILVYPLMHYINLNPILFIVISMCLLPQIILNGQNGHRPNLESSYYRHLVPFRFIIILYLKCYPYNVYELQPNYSLGLFCMILLAVQYSMLWAQKKYGPRKVLPNFILPKIYNYECQLQFNVQQNCQPEQCAICLSPLHMDPNQSQNQDANAQIKQLNEHNDANNMNNNLNPPPEQYAEGIPYKVMKSPCGHKYHGACLTQWMRIKMQCPQCRTKLPPFE